jgi:hypothetical protein
MTLIAKPVVEKKFWILTENDIKIGNVQAFNDGYQLEIDDQISQFKSLKSIEKTVNVKFEALPKKTVVKNSTVHGYPAPKIINNAVWDLNKKLPLFTKGIKSKCWYAAGWYNVQRNDEWDTIKCPKLIFLQRYSYEGPFHNKEEAERSECF